MNTLKQTQFSDLDLFLTDADIDTNMDDILLELEAMPFTVQFMDVFNTAIDRDLAEYYHLTNQGE